jgi:hypothetical protein
VSQMTSKELLYIEDALAHEQFMQQKCREAASKIKDPELRSFVEGMASAHQKTFGTLFQLLK